MGEPDDLDAMTPAERARVMKMLLALVTHPKGQKTLPKRLTSAKPSIGKTTKFRKGGGSPSSGGP